MLKRLYISNFALINEMDVFFPGKLSVITGETGAGKSIFLEALGLALGKRAELSALKNKNKKCIVEAEFEGVGAEMNDLFAELEIERDNNVILRREIGADGKSRSFLNDSLVNLNALKTLSERLIDIHSQHQTLLLNQNDFQLEVVDAFSGSQEIFREYKTAFSLVNKLRGELSALNAKENAAKKELDYFQFLFKELDETEIKPGLLKKLEDESAALENAESIKNNLSQSSNIIGSTEPSVLTGLAQAKQHLNGLTKFGQKFESLYERINSVYIELKDLASDIEQAEGDVIFDNIRLEETNAKMDKLNRLFKKHGAGDEEALLQIKTDIENKLNEFGSLENEIVIKNKQILAAYEDCIKKAKELTVRRMKGIPGIEKKVKEMLADLSMENAFFKIEIFSSKEISASGFEQVKFLFSANKGVPPGELQKIASGGELSRLMLSLKALLATKKKLPTIIFDEIDTGVSGDVADKIGNILHKMGNTMQVIAITHLPQMASKGSHHLFVYKEDEGERTVSFIKELNKDERVNEIAKMLSTGNPSVSALKNAKELLSV